MNRFLAVIALLIAPLAVRAENWPAWRGPTNNGISNEKGIPAEWGEGKNVAWKVALPGIAGSTPAVWGDRIYLTSAEGKDLVLMCLKTSDGSTVWKKKVAAAGRESIRKDEGNEAGASPTTDGKHVWSYFGTGDLFCHDVDGNEVWKHNLQKNYGRFSIQHGMHITPLVHGENIYSVLLTNGGHWVIAFDKLTGKEVWKHARKSDAKGESREAYSSPILWTTGKEPCLVVLGCDYTTAHDLKTGDEIWRLVDLNPLKTYSSALRIIASPVANKDELVVPTARGGLVVAMKPGATGRVDPESPFELWRKPKGAPDVPSPLIYDGYVYLGRENGMVHCWEALSGKEVYNQRIHEDRYRGSPVVVGGNIITTARGGVFTVIKAGPKADVIAVNTLKDIFTASPAISGGRMYLRGFSNLYAIEEKK